MSYQAFNNYKTADDPNQPQGQQPGSTFTATSSGATDGQPQQGGPQQSPQGQSQSTPSSSGRFTNLQSYLTANKDFNQSQGLAGKLTQNINQQANQFQKEVGQAQDQFHQQAQQGASTYYNPQPGSSQYVAPPTEYKTTDYVKQTLANPVKAGQQDVTNFQNLENASYQGPQDLTGVQGKQNYGYLTNQANNLQQNVKNAQTESGRFNLLKQQFSNPTYNTGQQALDNLIIQSSPKQLQQLSNAQSIAQKANLGLQGAEKNTQNLASQYQQLANSTRTGIAQDLGGAIGNIGDLNNKGSLVNQQLDEARKGLERNYDTSASNSLANRLANKQLSANEANDIAKALGLPMGEGLRTYGLNINPSNYFNQSESDVLRQLTPQMVLNSDQYKNLAALGQLAGNTGVGSSILSQFGDPSKAGNVNSLNPSINYTKLQQDLGAQKAKYDAVINPQSRAIQEASGALNSKFAHPELESPGGTDRFGRPIKDPIGDAYASGGINGAIKALANTLRQPSGADRFGRPIPSKYSGSDMDIINQYKNDNTKASWGGPSYTGQYGKYASDLINDFNFESSKLADAQAKAAAIEKIYSGGFNVDSNTYKQNPGLLGNPISHLMNSSPGATDAPLPPGVIQTPTGSQMTKEQMAADRADEATQAKQEANAALAASLTKDTPLGKGIAKGLTPKVKG